MRSEVEQSTLFSNINKQITTLMQQELSQFKMSLLKSIRNHQKVHQSDERTKLVASNQKVNEYFPIKSSRSSSSRKSINKKQIFENTQKAQERINQKIIKLGGRDNQQSKKKPQKQQKSMSCNKQAQNVPQIQQTKQCDKFFVQTKKVYAWETNDQNIKQNEQIIQNNRKNDHSEAYTISEQNSIEKQPIQNIESQRNSKQFVLSNLTGNKLKHSNHAVLNKLAFVKNPYLVNYLSNTAQ